MNARGALAAQRASTDCWFAPVGRSRYSGGLFGFGDHAAADANCARSPKGSFSESAGDLTAESAASLAAFVGPAARADMQHGLMTYRLPNTSGCFMPMRLAP